MGLRRRIVEALAPYPRVFYPLARLFIRANLRGCLVGDKTEIVISGYPRSANTFAVVAFAVVQQRPVVIAHHLHVEAQVMEAVRRGLPAIVLMRKPHDSVRSFKTALPSLDVDRALRRWIRFYTCVERLSNRVVISDFSCTTGDFASVIEEVNRKFGTDFLPFEDNEANRAIVYERMKIDQARFGTEQFAAVPSEQRAAELERMEVPMDPAMLAKAHALYERLVALRSVPGCRTCQA